MLDKIKEIEAALDAGWQHCALALTLTLPDICAKVLQSETKGHSNGEKYIEWFDKYVVPIYAPLGKIDKSFVTGKICYKLRCSFLHAGNFNLEKENIYFNPNYSSNNCSRCLASLSYGIFCTFNISLNK